MKQFARMLCCLCVIGALLLGLASAEEKMLASAGEGGFHEEMFLSAGCAAGGRVYLCDTFTHSNSYFSMTPEGEDIKKASSITWLEGEELYRSCLEMVSDGETAYAIEVTILDDRWIYYEEFGLYRLNAANLERELVAQIDLSEIVIGSKQQNLLDIKGTLLADGWLYTLFDSQANDEAFLLPAAEFQQVLLCDELATGKRVRIELTGALQLVYAQGGQVVYSRAQADSRDAALIALNPQTGEERKLMTVKGQGGRYPEHIVYFPEEGCLTFLSGSRLWGQRKGEEARIVGSVSVEEPVRVFAAGDKLVAMGRQGAARIDLDWDMEMETRQLTVTGSIPQMDDFARLRPDVEIVPDRTEEDRLVSAILTRSPTPDVILSQTSGQSIFAPLRDRGYLLPLKGDAIRKVGEAVYPELLAEISVEGEMVALPFGLQHGEMAKIQEELWNQLGLGEVPQSWPEFLNVLIAWPQIAQSHPELSPFLEKLPAEALSKALRSQILASYDLYRAEQERDPGYDTQAFRDLVRLQGEVNVEMLEQAYTGDGGNGLFTLVMLSGMETAPGYRDMPLAVEEGGEPLAGEGLWVMMINPYSQNQDLAMELLEYVAANLEPINRLEMMPGENEPIRYEDYQASLIEQEEYIADLEARLEQVEDPAERGEMEVALELHKQSLEASRDTWRASPQSIAGYRASHQHLRVRYLESLNPEDYYAVFQIRDRWSSGEMETEEFIAEMDRRILMRAREGA